MNERRSEIRETFGVSLGTLWCHWGAPNARVSRYGRLLGSLWGLCGATGGHQKPVYRDTRAFGVSLGALWCHCGITCGIKLGKYNAKEGDLMSTGSGYGVTLRVERTNERTDERTNERTKE